MRNAKRSELCYSPIRFDTQCKERKLYQMPANERHLTYIDSAELPEQNTSTTGQSGGTCILSKNPWQLAQSFKHAAKFYLSPLIQR